MDRVSLAVIYTATEGAAREGGQTSNKAQYREKERESEGGEGAKRGMKERLEV